MSRSGSTRGRQQHQQHNQAATFLFSMLPRMGTSVKRQHLAPRRSLARCWCWAGAGPVLLTLTSLPCVSPAWKPLRPSRSLPFLSRSKPRHGQRYGQRHRQRDRANPAVRTMITSRRMTAGVAGMAIAGLHCLRLC